MSAITIFNHAPIGATIEWSDGTPRAPDQHVAALFHWKWNNGRGVLVRKYGEGAADHHIQDSLFTLREGATIRSFSFNSILRFRIIARPPVGAVRILDGDHAGAELLHLAENWPDALAWRDAHVHAKAILEEVSADEVAADYVEGRIAA